MSHSAGLISPRTLSVGTHLAITLSSTEHEFHDWMIFQFLESLVFGMSVDLKDGQEQQKVGKLQRLSLAIRSKLGDCPIII